MMVLVDLVVALGFKWKTWLVELRPYMSLEPWFFGM